MLTCEHPGLRSVFGDACPACAEERALEPPITIEHARALLLSLDAEGERRSFREFVIGNWRAIEPNGRPFIANRGTDALIEHLQALGDGFINRLGIACAPGIGKPVHVDGLVLVLGRGLVRIGDVAIGDKILTHRGRYRRVVEVHEQGFLPIVELHTRRGRIVRAAGDHPFLTPSGWKRADQIIVGLDALAEVMPQEPCEGRSGITLEEARFIGYLIGDGGVSQPGTSFTNEDRETLDDFALCARSLGFDVVERQYPKRHGNGMLTSVRVRSTNAGRRTKKVDRGALRRWRVKHELDRKTSHTKRVPRAVMEGSDEVVKEYLAAYWACDGEISDRRDCPRAGRENQNVNAVRIEATTVSVGLARDHQALLLRLGMSFSLDHRIARITRVMVGPKSDRVGGEYPSCKVRSTSQDCAARFLAIVAPSIRHAKRVRVTNMHLRGFGQVLVADEVIKVKSGGFGACRCLTVEEDSSFAYDGVAAHNTSVASVAFPAWMWARNPAWRVICASYAAELAINIAGKFHRVVTSDRYREVHAQTRVVGEALKALNTSRGGYRYAVGVEGALTGFRADAGIIDDSLNAIDANSRQAMRTVNDWFDQAFMTRFDHGDDAPICVIQQRLGEHDLIAHARARGFEILELPARHEVGRVCRTSIWVDTRTIDGEILCPEIQSEKFLDEQLRVLGPRGFACQYAQRPAPREGNQFKIGMWGYHVMPGKIAGAHPRHEKARQGAPRELKYRSAMEGRMKSLDVDWGCLSIDATGGSTSETASALAIVGVVGAGEWRHVLRDYTDGPKGWRDTIAICRRSLVDFAGMTGRQRDLEVLVEKKALGQGALFEELVEAIGAGDLLYPDGTPIKAKVTYYDPTGRGDKAARATALEPDLDAGLITVEDGAGWVAPFLDEFGMFGGGASRDDRVDAVAQCIDHRRAKGKSTLTIKFPTVRSWGVR